ncbi:MAG TPA: hypothetical protein VN924_23090 [Bryobacteraceae bacterium]|nr:hypothetical protein [Bryobacteraceae bacterium]
MKSIVLSGLVCVLTAIAAPAQVAVGGGGSARVEIPAGATIWYGTAAPANTVGANGDYFLNTISYCLYGPKSAGVWSTACSTSVPQLGYTAENLGNKGVAGGYAPLDANTWLPTVNLPPIGAINGTSVPANSASDQTLLTTAPAIGTWSTLPSCPDFGGSHLNYSLVTHGFLCGDTGGTVGSVAFNGVGSGNNFNALVISGTLNYTAGGQINANQLGGVSLPSLPTGLLKITAGTGAPSVAAPSDVTAALGFTPENHANRGVANGYAPLDGSARLPALQMPLLTGDVGNTGLAATVVGLQSHAVAGTAPTNGQVLTWNAAGSAWAPATPTTGNAVVNPGGTPAANTVLVADGANSARWDTDTILFTDGALSTYRDPTSTGHNVFFGNGAGNRTMTPGGGSAGLASFNVGIGYDALEGLTTGNQNVGIGELALTANTTGQQNVAVGNLAMVLNTTGSYNTAVGENALGNNTTGYDNFAFGLRALYQNTTGYNNAAFGIDSVGINTTGYRNSGYGIDSCAWNVTGYENDCMGMNTLWSLTTGYDNAGMGFNAMFGVTSGHYLTGLGAYADMYYPSTSAGVTLTPTSATANLSVGWYWYKVSYVLNGQETALSNNSYLGVLTDAAHKEVTIAGIPTYTGPFVASARKIYRTVVCPTTLCTVITANQAPRQWYYVATIDDNVTTAYVDTTADANLGAQEGATPSKSIALGAYATVYGSYQMVVGSDASPVQQIWLGNGMVTAAAPAGVLVSSSGASGTNVAGQDHIIAGGPGTGTANGGNVIFGTVPGGAAGSTWNSLVNRWKVDSATGNLVSLSTGGIAGVTGTVDFSGGGHTLPAKAGIGASKPATCIVGEQYFATDASPGQNLFGCTVANTWTLEGGGGAGGGGAITSIFGRTGAVTAQSGDYTFAQIAGTLPDSALPADAVTTGIIANASLIGDFASLATTGNVTSGGTLTATGGVYANIGANVPGCLHLSDANSVHDMGVCAPSSGFNGQFNLWTGSGASGQVATTDGSLNLLWSNLGAIAGTLAAAQMPALAGDISNSGLATTVTALQGRPISSAAPADQQYLGWSASAAKWQPVTLPTTLNAIGGTVYNPAGAGNTQIVVKNSSSQAGNGAGSILWQNNAGATMSFINWDGGYAEGDGTNYKISVDTSTETLSSDSVIVWHNLNNAFSGAADTGLARETAGGILKVTNGAGGYGILDAGGLEINGATFATTLAGDVTGGIGANTVAKIQNRAIAATAPSDGQSLAWSAANSQWQPITISAGGGAVSSVFGRTGAVVAASGDYTAAQVTNALSSIQTYASPAWLTAVTFGGTTLNSTGGTIYNNAASGNTQIVIKNSSSQAANGAGSILWQNNAGSNVAFINWDGGYATGDGTNYKISLDTETASLSSDALMVWHNVNSVFAGTADVGLQRESAGLLKVTAGAVGYGAIDSGGYSTSGAAGVTSTTCTQWTNGLCTHN